MKLEHLEKDDLFYFKDDIKKVKFKVVYSLGPIILIEEVHNQGDYNYTSLFINKRTRFLATKEVVKTDPTLMELMKKVYWVNRYFERIENLFDRVDKQWLDEADKNYDSEKHIALTNLKRKICWRMKILIRYSSFLTSEALQQIR